MLRYQRSVPSSYPSASRKTHDVLRLFVNGPVGLKAQTEQTVQDKTNSRDALVLNFNAKFAKINTIVPSEECLAAVRVNVTWD